MKNKSIAQYLVKYYKEELHLFKKSFHSAGTFNKKNIHELRVSIKWLEALLGFVEILLPEEFEANKYRRAFKRIFRRAGKIRELHIYLEDLKALHVPFPILKEYCHFLEENNKRARKKFRKAIKAFDMRTANKSEHEINKRLHGISNEKVMKAFTVFIENKVLTLKRYSKPSISIENLHNIRRELKSFHTIVAFFYTMFPDKDLKLALARVTKINAAIGHIHDKKLLAVSLGEFNAWLMKK